MSGSCGVPWDTGATVGCTCSTNADGPRETLLGRITVGRHLDVHDRASGRMHIRFPLLAKQGSVPDRERPAPVLAWVDVHRLRRRCAVKSCIGVNVRCRDCGQGRCCNGQRIRRDTSKDNEQRATCHYTLQHTHSAQIEPHPFSCSPLRFHPSMPANTVGTLPA